MACLFDRLEHFRGLIVGQIAHGPSLIYSLGHEIDKFHALELQFLSKNGEVKVTMDGGQNM